MHNPGGALGTAQRDALEAATLGRSQARRAELERWLFAAGEGQPM